MQPRTMISDVAKSIGQTVRLCGWIHTRRDHGKLIFLDLRDRTGRVQIVVIPDAADAYAPAKELRNEYVVEIFGKVKERPGNADNDKLSTGRVEIEAESITILGKTTEELPLDISKPDLDIHLDTLLNNRTIALRNEKVRFIFEVYSETLRAYDEALRAENFVEIKTPKILSTATEGGANFFKIKYFDREAYLAQSPQFYKQAGMSVFERVFEIGTVFRAEPSYTSRHVTEYTGLDAEMGFIDSVEDVMAMLEKTMQHIFKSVKEHCPVQLERYKATTPEIIPIPRIRLSEAVKILSEKYGKETENEDIDSEGERLISEYVKEHYNSDLVFLTHYPKALRPFYSMPSADNPQYTETFDLIFRGIEIASGGQRIHDAEMLEENIKGKGLNPDQFKDYIDIFRFGTPPHGGWGLGSERITQKILGLQSVKEVVLYPRDANRLAP
jgi:nondiscriminating aspartyl-tRNA synthetase